VVVVVLVVVVVVVVVVVGGNVVVVVVGGNVVVVVVGGNVVVVVVGGNVVVVVVVVVVWKTVDDVDDVVADAAIPSAGDVGSYRNGSIPTRVPLARKNTSPFDVSDHTVGLLDPAPYMRFPIRNVPELVPSLVQGS
jgi:hypothetical protein